MPNMTMLAQTPEINIDLNQESNIITPFEERPETLPLIAVRELNLFPHMVMPIQLFSPSNQQLFSDSLNSHKHIALSLIKGQHNSDEIKKLSQLHTIAMEALVVRMVRGDNDSIRLLVQGVGRIRLQELVQTEPYLGVKVTPLNDVVDDDVETQALMATIKQAFGHLMEIAPQIPRELSYLMNSINDPGALADLVAGTINLKSEERQTILEELNVKKRLRHANVLLARENQVLELGNKIQSQVKEGLDKSQREFYLRQQLKAIQNELGEGESTATPEIDHLQKQLRAKKLPPDVRKEAERELNRLSQIHNASSDYHVIMEYINWILALPWMEETTDVINLEKARHVLEMRHYGLEKVKRRILEYLAVLKLNPEMKGPILCLVGPPGVGKTSLGRSIAEAIGRKFVRLSLGGVRDEAEIRGHRRTYVGALPGRIIQSLRRAGSKNPVFILDEIDKLGDSIQGAPASALLEVLDPEQNNSFSDHYLELPFDLSRIMFITTANMLDTIPAPLRDRMEVLEIPGYTRDEKLKIAKKYLIPKQRKNHGLKSEQFKITDSALRLVIDSYTREAGLRNLERELANLCRFAARSIAEGEQTSINVTPPVVQQILGPETYVSEVALRKPQPGIVTGMAWTPVGGEILFIEATSMPGKGGLNLTGKLGDVMKESAQTALSYLRANAGRLGIDDAYFSNHDIHVHVPAGATPKDGPSAGVTIFTALLSLMQARPVKVDVAMTGEITLRGMVLPVGGIKEKVLGAQQAGIKTILLPKQNERDFMEVPAQVRKELNVVLLEQVEDIIEHALLPQKPAAGTKNPRQHGAKKAKE